MTNGLKYGIIIVEGTTGTNNSRKVVSSMTRMSLQEAISTIVPTYAESVKKVGKVYYLVKGDKEEAIGNGYDVVRVAKTLLKNRENLVKWMESLKPEPVDPSVDAWINEMEAQFS